LDARKELNLIGNQRSMKMLTHLDRPEAKSIHIMREVAAEADSEARGPTTAG